MNFKSTYPEEFSFYLFDTLQEHLHYAELDFDTFSAYFDMPSLKHLRGKYWILARSECLIKICEIIRNRIHFTSYVSNEQIT